MNFYFSLVANVFVLCVRAGFGAQNFNLLLKFIRSAKLQVCTSARLTQNPCYRLAFLSYVVAVHHFPLFLLLSSLHNIWQFSALVCPPKCQGVMWSASISSILYSSVQTGQIPFCLSYASRF